jgi:TolB-like protein/class 3 adenylate cyclase/Tfp pilus assembly protein PilF
MPSSQSARAALPLGTVTFLFTDIEGSTRLWEKQRASMQTALARHDALLREVIEAHGGHLVKTTGDGALGAFESATDALNTAVAAQKAVSAERWPDPVRIRVRMSLHTGPAELRDGDYFGPTLNRLARLLALAHGGQTLMSAVTRDLCRDFLPPTVSIESLGEHALKDLDRHELVFEVRHSGQRETFPPLRVFSAARDENAPSIAVLPFVNMSRDEDYEYFADGLAEQLLSVLAKIHGLHVAARTSSFHFKGKDVTIAEVGRALNVATVLEGSVRASGNRMRIAVQLIKVADSHHLWSEMYDRTLDDIFAVQDDIAQSVVKELRTTLLGEAADAKAAEKVSAQVAAAVKGRASDPKAYRQYLQARHFIDRSTREDVAKGIGYLKQALDLDSAFALGWAELGGAYAKEADRGWAPVTEGYRRAREAAARALVVEPDLAEGHAQMGWIQMAYDWDWRGAEASYHRALELAPGNALVLRRASTLLGNLGRLDEAIALGRRAVEQDPLSVIAYHNLGLALNYSGSLAEAEVAFRKALELAPQRANARAYLSLNLLAQGRGGDAMAEALREPEEWARLWASAIIHHAANRRDDSEAALQDLIARHQIEDAFQVAQVYAVRGEADLAFEWLERAYVQRDGGLTSMKIDAYLRPLRADLRWDAFLRKMGLAD